MTGATINVGGKKIVMDRTYNSSPTRTPPSITKIGINNGTLATSDTALDNPIPIQNGTINFRCNAVFTGSGGGDNSTNNTTTYKTDGVSTDVTAQNLIANATSTTKTWVRSTLDSNFTATYYPGFWLYIKDATTLAKFKTSGTCLEARWRSDSTNYYAKTWTVADLATGWNWLYSATVINALTTTGTPGTLDEFAIIITTNNSTDTFVAGDVIIDVVRTWQATDLQQAIATLAIDETTLEATLRTNITTIQAVGFAIDSTSLENDAGTQFSEAVFSERGKGLTDEVVFITKHKHA